MKVIILVLMSGAFLMACSPTANFDSNDASFKSLMDGETVEVLENNDLIDSLDQVNTDADDGNSSTDAETVTNDEDDGKKVDRHRSGTERVGHCKERLVKEDNENKGHSVENDRPKTSHELFTSPEDMDSDASVDKVIGCGDDNVKKVQVCHHPNADYSKRKTLCIGRPALEAHLRHMGAKRGSDHVDYAGPCRDDVEEESTDDV